jgi:hypothetical protein
MESNEEKLPSGSGEKDCKILGKGGKDEDCSNWSRSGDGRIQMWGLSEEGRTEGMPEVTAGREFIFH